VNTPAYHFVRINSDHLELKDMLPAKSEVTKPVQAKAFFCQGPCDLDLWHEPQNQYGSSTYHDQHKYQMLRLWIKGILSYLADKEKPTDGRMGWRPDGQGDPSIPPYNFVLRGYNYIF
jgi:hypothetical protein